jgi:RimJ/RimL family protein N-acetyltransferase
VIEIQPMKPHHLEQVIKLKLTEEQIRFVGTMDEILVNINSDVHPHVILVKEVVVGFFLIDTRYWQDYDFTKSPGLGLRAYFISHQFQGRGYGKQAVESLGEYLASIYPDKNEVHLMVNYKNLTAKHCYLSGGFVDTGERYLGGIAGPQHIMCLKLR